MTKANQKDLGIRDPAKTQAQSYYGLVKLLLPRLGDRQIDITGRRIGDVLQYLAIDPLGFKVFPFGLESLCLLDELEQADLVLRVGRLEPGLAGAKFT